MVATNAIIRVEYFTSLRRLSANWFRRSNNTDVITLGQCRTKPIYDMADPNDYELIMKESTAEIVRLHRRVHETLGDRDKSDECRQAWFDACAEFRRRHDELAFLGGASSAIRRMRSSDQVAIEYGLLFIETRPYFFRSGYMYNHFLRVLRNCELTAMQRMRYNNVYARHLEYRLTRD